MLKKNKKMTKVEKMEKKIDLLNSMIVCKDNPKLFRQLEKTYKKVK